MSFLTSAFATMGNLGVGQLGSASVAYRFEAPIVVRAEMAPFGIAGPTSFTSSSGVETGGHSVTVFASHFVLGLDTELVEVGLGVGGASVNQNSTFGVGGVPATGAFSLAEEARLGARDGLAVSIETSAIAVNDKFQLGYFVGSLQIPFSRTIMLVVRGGGGNVGFAYGDLGIRVLVHGDGSKGTLALTGFAGGALIQENLCSTNPDSSFAFSCNSASLGGPSLGGGVEWKL
jgi:hypothetical protein